MSTTSEGHLLPSISTCPPPGPDKALSGGGHKQALQPCPAQTAGGPRRHGHRLGGRGHPGHGCTPRPYSRPGHCLSVSLNHVLCTFTVAAGETPAGHSGPFWHCGTFLAGGNGGGGVEQPTVHGVLSGQVQLTSGAARRWDLGQVVRLSEHWLLISKVGIMTPPCKVVSVKGHHVNRHLDATETVICCFRQHFHTDHAVLVGVMLRCVCCGLNPP